MLRDRWFQELPAEDIEAGECALLVTSHQPAIADDICRKDGRKAALNVLFGHRERPCLSLCAASLWASVQGVYRGRQSFRVCAIQFRFSPDIRRIVATLRAGSILNAPEPASNFVQRPRQSSPLMFARRAGAAKQNARRP